MACSTLWKPTCARQAEAPCRPLQRRRLSSRCDHPQQRWGGAAVALRRGQGFHSRVTCLAPSVISRARERRTRLREQLKPPWPSLNRNSDSRQPSPSSRGTRIDSRNPPEMTASTILVILLDRPVGRFVAGVAATIREWFSAPGAEPQMQPWKLSESHHDWRGLRIMRDESYGRTRKAFPAQFVVRIVSLQSLDRELSLQPVEQLRRCGLQSWNRSGLVTREYASSGGPSIPHQPPRMSLPPGEGINAALRERYRRHRSCPVEALTFASGLAGSDRMYCEPPKRRRIAPPRPVQCSTSPVPSSPGPRTRGGRIRITGGMAALSANSGDVYRVRMQVDSTMESPRSVRGIAGHALPRLPLPHGDHHCDRGVLHAAQR